MKKVSAVFLALIFMVQMAAATEYTGSFADLKLKAAEIGKPILVDFFTEW